MIALSKSRFKQGLECPNKLYFSNNKESYSSEKLKTIRGEVMNDYQNFLEENWISDLRATSEIKIRKRALKKLIKFYEIK